MKREDLLHALEIVKPGLASKEMIEQSTSFVFLKDRVCTYNDDIAISHPVPGLSLVLEGAIRAEELYKLLSKIKKDEIVIEQSETELVLKAGKAKAGLALQSEIKLPLEDIEVQEKWKRVPEDLIPAIQFAVPSCSKDNTRPVLTCVYVTTDGRVEASDNYRITRYKIGDMPSSFLLPAATAKDIVNYKIVKVAGGKGWIHFKTEEETILSCRIYKGTFPDITDLLAVEGQEFKFPKLLTDVLERAEIFAEQESKDQMIKIIVRDNVMQVRAKNPVGWFIEEVKVTFDGEPFSFGINPNLLKSIAMQTRNCVIGKRCIKFTADKWEHVVSLIAGEF